jgi:hypothetical protein
MLLGCLLVIVIGSSQFLGTQNLQESKAVKTEQQSEADHASFISLPSFSLPSPVHVQINLDFHCLFEIVFQRSEQQDRPLEIPSFGQFFVTLFRVIISPNAP